MGLPLALTAASMAGCSASRWIAGDHNVTLSVGGLERTFALRVPWQQCSAPRGEWCTGGPPATPTPLVLNWHGCNAHYPIVAYQLEVSRMNDAASDLGWHTIAPLGTQSPLGGGWGWNTQMGISGAECAAGGRVDDYAFAEALLDFAERELCVDMSAVFTAGFSTGAFMSYGLGCRMADRFAGVAANAGAVARARIDECAAGPPISVLSLHSLADPTVPYNGTAVWASQPEVDAMWRRRNGCRGGESTTTTVSTATTQCVRTDCPGAPVETCTVRGLDHCWIGGRSGGFASCEARPGDVDGTRHMLDGWRR